MTSVPVERRVGRYEILSEIGRGATSVVHLARQTDLDRDVALKELALSAASDSALVERFLRESRLVAGLNHPNVVTVYEYFEHDGTPFIAMEYFPRGSLRPLVGSLELVQIVGVLDCILAGLAHAETRGVVHRDLKPENLLVTANGMIKIADFGIAKVLDAESGSLTQTGAAVGTPAYMAPEQAVAGEVGPKADLYATGVIAYELLAGSVPFHASPVPMAVMLQHLNDPVPPLRAARPDLDPELCDWVERMLAKRPDQRPPGATAAQDELDEIVIRVLGARWRRQSRLTGSTPAVPVTAQAATPATVRIPSPAPTRRRSLTVALASALAIVLVAAGVSTAVLLADDDASGSAQSTRSTQPTTEPIRPEPAARPTLNAVDLDTRANPASATFRFAGGTSAPRIVLRDSDVTDGHGWFELRSLGIVGRTAGATNDALAVRVRKARNVLRIDVRADTDAFETLAVARRGGHVVATLSRPAQNDVPVEQSDTTPVTGSTDTTATTTTSEPEKKPLPTG